MGTDQPKPIPDQIRTLLHWVIFGVIFDLAVSIGLAVVAIYGSNTHDKAVAAAVQAKAAKVATYQTCLANNDFRADNLKLWLSVIRLIPADTPSGKAFDQSLRQLATAADTVRDCGPPP